MFFSPDIPPHERSWPRRLLNRLEVDRAVFYSLAARAWQLFAGPVTWVVIAAYFTPELQGFYYTFASLMALSVLAEMSLNVVIMNAASHEWSKLALDERGMPTGDSSALSRLASLARFALRWYAAVAILFAAGMGIAGGMFLAQKPHSGFDWLAPWVTVVAFTSLSLVALPFTAILSGCGQIAVVNRFRVLQAISGNVAVWILIPLGAQLWTMAAVAAVTLFWDAYAILVRYRSFYRGILSAPKSESVDVAAEVRPLQWRIAVQSIALSLSSSIFTLVMFHYHGAAAAGRMGMTWAALTALHRGALAWVQVRAPRFGVLVAQRDFDELDRIYNRVVGVSFVLRAVGGMVFFLLILLLDFGSHPLAERIADRVLPPSALLLFVLAVILDHFPSAQMIYARAHKREPYFLLSLITNAALVAAVWALGSGSLGAWGEGLAYLAVTAGLTVPLFTWVWMRSRREWRM